MESDAPRVAFVCVQNAGRSQMAAAFARREAERSEASNRASGRSERSERRHARREADRREASERASGEAPRREADRREASERASGGRSTEGRPPDGRAVTVGNREPGAERPASREADARGLDVEILTGGTDPADAVHPEVVEVMDERGIDLSGREPREISTDELESCRLVVTMGCSTLQLDADVDVRDWALPDPDGEDLDRVREIRDEVERRVRDIFEGLERETAVER
jgi:protein-tyrosine-phosphatase